MTLKGFSGKKKKGIKNWLIFQALAEQESFLNSKGEIILHFEEETTKFAITANKKTRNFCQLGMCYMQFEAGASSL